MAVAAGASHSIAPANASVLPFRVFDGYAIVVQTTLGTSGRKYNLMIDTGANPTVLDRKVANDLGLVGQPVTIALDNGLVKAPLVKVAVFNFGPVRRENISVLVRDLAFVQRHLDIHLDGIIGMDVLSGMNFTIDYQHRLLLFGSAARMDGEAAEFASPPPFVTVAVTVSGEPMKMLVDTGTAATMLFKTRTRGRLKHSRFMGSARGANLAGALDVDQLIVPELQLGNLKLREQPADLVNDDGKWGGAFDGLVSPSALNLKRLTFDFDKHEVRWER